MRAVLLCLALVVVACNAGSGGVGSNAHDALADAGGADAGDADAGPRANADSPLGTNLTGVSDWNSEWPFVDAFKMSRAWISGSDGMWADGRALDLDADGWIRSLEAGQIARTLVFTDLAGRYPSGRYVLLYDGEGTIRYGGAATRDASASSPGRDVLEVDASRGTIFLEITATTPSSYLRNLRLIMPGGVCDEEPLRWCDESAPCGAGSCARFEDHYESQIFHPIFLERIASYRVLRFMDWMETNDSTQIEWADRPRVSDARWSAHGVPVEIMIELANRMGADPWFTVPHLASDDYVTRLAEAVAGGLAPGATVYVEHSNEVWNGIFGQATHARNRGLELGLSTNAFQAQLYYHSLRSVQIFQLWQAVFGGTDRLVRVMGSQASNAWVSEQVLDFGEAATHTDALAIAPYFGGELGTPGEQARVAAASLDELMTELEEVALPRAAASMTESAAVASARGVPLIAYEAGQHLAGHGGVENDEVINALFDSANRSPRMKAIYLAYLDAWRAAGGELLVHFVNCSAYSKWGRWGALEYVSQDRADAPKYDALQTFIEGTPRWW